MAKTTKRAGRPRKTTTNVPHGTKRVTKTIPFSNMNDVASNVNTVLQSLIEQDGRFTTTEAKAISMLYGNQLAYAKIKLDVHRLRTTSTTEAKDVLKLS